MRLVAILMASVLLGAASLAGARDQLAGSLSVYAATSLTDAFEALKEAFVERHPEVEILLNFANSATLAAQIQAGAPADLFASANELQMGKAVASGRVDEAEIEIFAHNRLVVIVPKDNPADIQSLRDLAGGGVLLVLAAPGTPIRAYADAMLDSHNSDYGEGFSERVMRNLASEESNVRQVVARVALGEADAGVVYQSDALGDVAEKLIVIAIDERHNQLASYPIAPINDTAAQALARAFIAFLRSREAQSILAANGFCWSRAPEAIQPSEATPAPSLDAEAPDAGPKVECEAATLEDR